jgi:hypothetical protein
MNAHPTTSTAKPASSHDCGCGCGGRCGCESRCCELECLVRPNFYCGQLLTDVDLDALVDWTRKRFALERYRDGWGVVCGLQLSCSPLAGARACCGDTAKGARIYVKPGYAIDCCGNDLVVCEPLAVDLTGVCQDDDDPCAPAKPAAGQAPPQRRGQALDAIWAKCIGDGELIPVELFLRYGEDLSQGQRPLFGGNCGSDQSCEYARVLERPCVSARRAITQDPAPDPMDVFRANQAQARKDILAAIAGGARAIREYLRQHPIAYMCFIEDLRCCHAEIEGRTKTGSAAEKKAAGEELTAMGEELARWLFYDWFRQQLDCDCFSCKPDNGVPIGRVYLFRPADGKSECRVVLVDADETYRRPLSRDECGVSIKGLVDLRRYYGTAFESAERALTTSGFNVTKEPQAVGGGAAAAMLAQPFELAATPGEVVLHVARDPLGVERVIAVRTPIKP